MRYDLIGVTDFKAAVLDSKEAETLPAALSHIYIRHFALFMSQSLRASLTTRIDHIYRSIIHR